VRSHPRNKGAARLSNIIAYKAGMLNIMMIDDSESPSKQQEVSKACTILELPEMELYGIRFYKKNPITGYREVGAELYSKALLQKAGIKDTKNDETKLPEFKSGISKYSDVTALIVANTRSTSGEQNHRERFESGIDAPDINSKLEFISVNLGKEVKAELAFKTGEHVDVTSITQGKGWQGVNKRYGLARLSHKATQKERHVGALVSFGIGKVMYTVPQAGQMGFNYRTEKNKRILQMGGKERSKEINKPSGFPNYGVVKGSYIIIEGSIPGTAKRLVRIRESTSPMINAKPIKEPKIISIS
jgi:large subunit ribosomal protein L3